MSKHTPGPWFHHGPSGSEHTAGGFIKSSPERNSGPLICSIYGTDGQPHQANARLISVAPDLLKALEEMVDNEEQVEFESWLSDFSPSGDVDSVTAQWLASSRFEDFCASVEPQLKAIAKAKGP